MSIDIINLDFKAINNQLTEEMGMAKQHGPPIGEDQLFLQVSIEKFLLQIFQTKQFKLQHKLKSKTLILKSFLKYCFYLVFFLNLEHYIHFNNNITTSNTCMLHCVDTNSLLLILLTCRTFLFVSQCILCGGGREIHRVVPLQR